MTPDVSVIVVAHDVREEVLACLASVEQHAGVGTEVFLVDNGSTDGTAEAVASVFPAVEVVSLEDLDRAAQLLAEFCASVSPAMEWIP